MIASSRGERELVAEILAGNHERYYELIAPIERRVYYTAYGILRTEADAEEVVARGDPQGVQRLAHISWGGEIL